MFNSILIQYVNNCRVFFLFTPTNVFDFDANVQWFLERFVSEKFDVALINSVRIVSI